MVFLLILIWPGVQVNAERSPGSGIRDTIRVITHDQETVVTDPATGTKSYLRWGHFPGKEVPIRKIILHVTFGCPDSLRCADWDYLDHIILERAGGIGGERLGWEIGRMLTPYGGFFSRDWEFSWEVDVTDFSPVLRDSAEINYIHSGYEPSDDRGWKITLEFEIITGTPSLRPVSITQLFNGHYPYGDSLHPFEDSLRPVSFSVPDGARFARLRILQTGHGMDVPDNCAEFCPKYREIWFDRSLLQKRTLWKECADNPLSPQAGTWIFDRGNWCPGLLMQPEIIDIPVIPGNSHTLNLIMEHYQATEINQGKQVISTYLVQYESPISITDVAIEEIMIPGDKDLYRRMNPVGENALIRVSNQGRDFLESLDILHGTDGFPVKKFMWQGKIAPAQSALIELPGPIESHREVSQYRVSILKANGKSDEYPADNEMTSRFTPAPVHDSLLVFYLLTNNEPAHNGWQLLGPGNIVVRERPAGTLQPATVYLDTFRLDPGHYRLILSDTAGDGLEFWFNSAGGRGEAMLLDINRNLIRSFEPDCGAGWAYDFSVGPNPMPIDSSATAISAYPARSSSSTILRYRANTTSDITVRLVADPGGDIVEEHCYYQVKEGVYTFNLQNSLYFQPAKLPVWPVLPESAQWRPGNLQ